MAPDAPPRYAELDCLSNFSFLRGASHPEELVERAAQAGYEALALADEASLAGIVRGWTHARKHGLKLIPASRFVIDHHHLIILPTTAHGYGNLSQLITLARGRRPKGHYQLDLNDLRHPPAPYSHLAGLPDCLVIFRPAPGTPALALQEPVAFLAHTFPGRLWLGTSLRHLPHDLPHFRLLETLAEHFRLPRVACGQVEMHVRSRQPVHDAFTALRLKKPVHECGYALYPNAEHHLRNRYRLSRLFPQALLAETVHIARQCHFSLDEIRYSYPDEIVPEGHTLRSYLRQETYAGAQRRYPHGISSRLRSQLESELAIIASLNYEAYFLTVYDIVQFARSQDILCQGRGSAANSAVCYCLGITEVNPENGNTLFARFISQARKEPPDIDVDFEHQRREEVIQYVYRKYGRHRAALAAVVITYRTRSALRDSGRALGIDPDIIDAVAKSHLHWVSKHNFLQCLHEHGMDPADHRTVQWAALAHTLLGFPRHLSQHPGGFVIAQSALGRLVPLENAAMPERTLVQWDKDDLDAMGLLKIDILALGMLSALQRCLKLVALRRGAPFGLDDIPHHDEATFAMTRQADTVGVFQIESRAQMSMLPRLAPRQFYDLVVQVAIVRPGPIQGGMVHPYLRRRMGLEPADSPMPEIAHILKRTLGVPIFQEQAMQIAIQAANFTADEADQLRRSMAAWRRTGGVDAFRERLFKGLTGNHCPEEFAHAIIQQLEGFGEYGFPESHAASFAKLAYLSAWLKCHEPQAFLAALLNSQPMGFYSPSQLVQDARRHGVVVLPPTVNDSQWETTLEPGTGPAAVRLGLHLVRGLGKACAQALHSARRNGPFTSLHDLRSRVHLSQHDLNALAAANALQSLTTHRRHASWQAATPGHSGLLRTVPLRETGNPVLPEPSPAENTLDDYRSLGLTLGRHPVFFLRALLDTRRFTPASHLHDRFPPGRLARACGLVTGRQRPQTAKGTVFVTLEDETGNVNVIVHADLAGRQADELVNARLLGVYGVWQRRQGVCHLLAKRLINLSHLIPRLHTCSRDFR
jgi:error-prone DNA polymerase